MALLVVALVVGNAAILATAAWARHTTPTERIEVDGVRNAVAVDDRVWRGGAPTGTGYRNLVAAGVTTIVDLRSDSERGPSVDVLDELDVRTVRLPIRDGQLPTDDEIRQFLDIVESADGTVFVHCGAGVGRTGAMVAAYLNSIGEAGGSAVRRNLAVGPPSLEQIAFAARGGDRPGPVVTALSRVLDSPRRIWHNL